MDKSTAFIAEWFRNKVDNWSEGPRLDFKRAIYKLDNDETKFMLARHVIAFANVARRIGKPCWMLFGVDDKEREALHDVRHQYACKDRPHGWNNPKWSIHSKQIDKVEEVFRNILKDWVGPELPDFRLEYGEVDGVFVSYLEIEYTSSSKPFFLNRSYTRKNTDFQRGDVFIRKGSSSIRLAKSEVKYLLQLNEAEYLREGEWRELVITHAEGFFKDAYFLPPFYQPKVQGEEISVLDAVIGALEAGHRSVLLTGYAGEGKTILLHRAAYRLAIKHNIEDKVADRDYFGHHDDEIEENYIVDSLFDDIEVFTPLKVPVFMEMRKAFESIDNFERILLKHIQDATGKRTLKSIKRLFRIPKSHWVILLDGIDEIRDRREFGPKLRSWVEQLPNNVQVVLTARPYAAEGYVEKILPIAQLTNDEAISILKGKISDVSRSVSEDVDLVKFESDVELWLRSNPKLLSLILRQRAMEGLIKLLDERFLQEQSEIDYEKTEIVKKTSIEHISGIGVVPKLKYTISEPDDNNDPSNDDPNGDGPVTIEEDQESIYILPDIALAVQAIVEHMNNEELKRKKDWGDDQRQFANDAITDIEKTAWYTNWAINEFNAERFREKGWLRENSRDWNKDVGFIKQEAASRRVYKFLCSLLQRYFAASYAYDTYRNDEISLINLVINRNVNQSSTLEVTSLINQLRNSNGYQKIDYIIRRLT